MPAPSRFVDSTVVARCYSSNRSTGGETQEYIHALIAAAGAKGLRLFPAESCNSVYKATDGVPRLINQVCDHALLLACAGGKRQVEPGLVEEAWADLQQLPTPWNEQSNSEGEHHRIGGLEDEPADAEKADAAKGSRRPSTPNKLQATGRPPTPSREAKTDAEPRSVAARCRKSTNPKRPSWSRASNSSGLSICWRTSNRSFPRPARSAPRSSWSSTSRSTPSASRSRKKK